MIPTTNLPTSSTHPPRPSFVPPPPTSASVVPPTPPTTSNPILSKSPALLDPEAELIQTEESYVNDLRVLVETFVNPLEKWFTTFDFTKPNRSSPDFTLETIAFEQNINIIEALFANIKVILQCNQLLLDGLHSAEKTHVEGAVVASFVKHAPYLKLYSQYTKNCQRATELLTQLRTDIRFSSFITCAELQKQCRGLNLQSFLIMPIQRGPRYELLLKEMKKHAKTLELKELIQKAIGIIVSVIKNIDSAVVGDEKRDKLIEIQEAFRITLTDPARYVAKCGDLKKICHNGKRVFYFVLCNDLFFYGEEMAGLFTKNSKQRYKFHREILLSDLRLVLISSDSKSFIIVGPDKAFEVEANSTEECSTWVEALIELKAAKTLNIHRTAAPSSKPLRIIKLWQIDNVVGSVRLAKYSIPDGKDIGDGVIMMDDLIPLEDEVGIENYRDSLSMSNFGSTNSLDKTSSLKMSFRNRVDSAGATPTNSTRVPSRSKSVNSTSTTSSDLLSVDDLKLPTAESTPSVVAQVFDPFAGEMLLPTTGCEPPKLHSVWSAEFEENSGGRKSLPRPVSSPDVRTASGMIELRLSNERNSDITTNGITPLSSVPIESAFLPKPTMPPPPPPTLLNNSTGQQAHAVQPSNTNQKVASHRPQQPSFVEGDDLFEFLTSDQQVTNQQQPQNSQHPVTTSSNATHHPPQSESKLQSKSQSKKLILDNEKYITCRK